MEGFLRSLEGEDSVESTAWNVPGRKRMCEYVMATVFCLEVEGLLPADESELDWIMERTPGWTDSASACSLELIGRLINHNQQYFSFITK